MRQKALREEEPNHVAELELLNWMLISVRERCDQLQFEEVSSLVAQAQSEMAMRIVDATVTRKRQLN